MGFRAPSIKDLLNQIDDELDDEDEDNIYYRLKKTITVPVPNEIQNAVSCQRYANI